MAVRYTPQHGDAFVELLRLQLLEQVRVVTVLYLVWTVLYMVMTVSYLVLTVLYLVLTVLFARCRWPSATRRSMATRSSICFAYSC